MIVRLLAAALVVLGSCSAGFLLAFSLRSRAKELVEVQTAVRMLITEIDYAGSPLPSALAQLSRDAPGIGGLFMRHAYERVEEEPDRETGRSWLLAIDDLLLRSSLRPLDVDGLRMLAPVLGQSARDDQVRHLELCVQRVQHAVDAAQRDAEHDVRMWQMLGVFGGLLLVLITF